MTTSQISQEHLLSLVTKAVVDVSSNKVAGITEATKLADLNLDSLAAMEILMKVESEVKTATGKKSISLPDTILSESETIGDLVNSVHKHVGVA